MSACCLPTCNREQIIMFLSKVNSSNCGLHFILLFKDIALALIPVFLFHHRFIFPGILCNIKKKKLLLPIHLSLASTYLTNLLLFLCLPVLQY